MIRRKRSLAVRTAALCCLVAICCFVSDARGAAINVAQYYGAASQSTTGFGLPASIAINGMATGDISHTDTGDTAPFWQVDLGSEFAIENINLFNWTNPCCGERLYNITVDILDASAANVFSSTVLNPWDGTGTIPADPGAGPFGYDMTALAGGFVTGQTVRVSKAGFAGSEWLALLEVEVFAAAALPNVALNKPTSGDAAFGYLTPNGNDGRADNFTHAANPNPPPDNPFWMVDLEGEFNLSHIELFDRADACCDPNRLEGSVLTVLDASLTPIYTSAPIAGLSVPPSGQLLTFDNGGAGFLGAAHIRVDGANQYFQFAELRAFAIPEPTTFALLGVALVGGLTMARRSRDRRVHFE